jgi:hypothetical protein
MLPYQIKTDKLIFKINKDATEYSWSSDKLPLKNAENHDFWRLHLDDGEYRELTVRSRNQKGIVEGIENGLIIKYQKLVADDGRAFEIDLAVNIIKKNENLEVWAEVYNHDDIRVNEVQVPFMELSVIGSENREKDILYRCNGLGERIQNPWEALKSAHTEYKSADYNQIWSTITYPFPSSMGWLGIESGNHFLYIGRHDEQFRVCNLCTGLAPRHAKPKLILAVSHFPVAVKGEKIECGHSIVTLREGDWKTGTDIYGNWARSTWYSVPEKPEWVKNLTGWHRIILKHQYGEIFFKYNDLPRLYREGLKYGLNMLLVFGWWKGRFDNGYPLYEPDPALGGEEELKKAIKDIQDMGGRVALYTNGILIDVTSDYYKTEGFRICRKDIDNNEYREYYRFSNNGTMLRTFGYKTFVSACQATDSWRNKLIENGKIKLRFNPDSIFYDQIGGHTPSLCFDTTHKHGGRCDDEPGYLVENLRAIRSLCTGDKALGSEHIVDIAAPYLDYHHGCGVGTYYSKNTFPALYKRTFPESIITNRYIHDNRDNFKQELNFAFAYGHRFDVSIYRGRVCGIAGIPEYGDYIKKLIDLKEKYHKFFYGGRIISVEKLNQPEDVIKVEYVSVNNDHMQVLWNNSNKDVSVNVDGKEIAIKAQDVCVIT